MMRSNPLITEVLTGLGRGGKAQLDYLGLLVLQAAVLLVWWPKSAVAQMVENHQSPRTLAAVVMAAGVTMAYYALRAGAEEIMLPGQRGLRVWARETSLHPGRIVRGYVLGQVLQSLHLLILSSPLLLMAVTVSGGEWPALGWCVLAVLIQALFYRLCGAIAHFMVGQHAGASYYTVRAILLLVYVPIGLLAPVTSHLAISYRTLGEDVPTQPANIALSDSVIFLAIYAVASILAALALHRLLLRERGRMTPSSTDHSIDRALTG